MTTLNEITMTSPFLGNRSLCLALGLNSETSLFWLSKRCWWIPLRTWLRMVWSIPGATSIHHDTKMKNLDAFLMAEVYQPGLIPRLHSSRQMDYLYNKVDLYDGLKAIMQGKASATCSEVRHQMMDIELTTCCASWIIPWWATHPSPDFVGNPNIAKPAVTSSALLRAVLQPWSTLDKKSGEPGAENAGFGHHALLYSITWILI